MTSNPPPSLTIDPIDVIPLPQSIVAVKSVETAFGFVSVNDPTMVFKGFPSTIEIGEIFCPTKGASATDAF